MLLAQIVLVLIKVEEFLWDRAGRWLIIRVMVWLEVGVLKCLVNGNTLDRIESEKLLKEVKSKVGGLGEHLLEWNLLLERKRADVLASSAGLDAIVVLHGRRTKDVEDESQLMVI